ncbi:MAG: hypothetical protein WCA56_03615 [Xanthobacteraceae bacterium]
MTSKKTATAMRNTIHDTATVLNPMEQAMTISNETIAPSDVRESKARNEKNVIANLLEDLENARKLKGEDDPSAITQEEWEVILRAAGLQVHAETAELIFVYSLDRFGYDDGRGGVYPDYFARNPGSDEWIPLFDLPDATQDALIEMHDLDL